MWVWVCVCRGAVSSGLGVQQGRFQHQSYSVSQWAGPALHSPAPRPAEALSLPANSRWQTTAGQPAAVTGAGRPGPEGEAAVGSQREVEAASTWGVLEAHCLSFR